MMLSRRTMNTLSIFLLILAHCGHVVAQPASPPSRRYHARAARLMEIRQDPDEVEQLAADPGRIVPSSPPARGAEASSVSGTSSVSSSSAVSTSSSSTTTEASASASEEHLSSTSSTTSSTSSEQFSSTSAAPSSTSSETSTTPTSTPEAPSSAPPTTLEPKSTVGTSTVTKVVGPSTVRQTSTSRPSTTANAANDKDSGSDKIGGLPKTTFIIIIAVASSVVLIALAWTAFRKWKLRPSSRFNSKGNKPVNFDPDHMGRDDFLEKTLKRSPSLDRQRQQFVAELDRTEQNYVEGVPEHDFTALGASSHGHSLGQGGYGVGDEEGMYHSDPFAHTAAYDYPAQAGYYQPEQYGGNAGDAGHYPSSGGSGHGHGGYEADYPTQDTGEGYSDLQRGNSGSSHGSVRPSDFPMPDQYLGRPTQGGDGPYAQAAAGYNRY